MTEYRLILRLTKYPIAYYRYCRFYVDGWLIESTIQRCLCSCNLQDSLHSFVCLRTSKYYRIFIEEVKNLIKMLKINLSVTLQISSQNRKISQHKKSSFTCWMMHAVVNMSSFITREIKRAKDLTIKLISPSRQVNRKQEVPK